MPRNNGKQKRAERKASALLRQAAYAELTAKERSEKQAQFVARKNAMIGADLAAGLANLFDEDE